MSNRVKIDNSVNGVRSKQNLSCNWTGSADFGRLIPIHWEELIPGDHVITCKPRIEAQLLPLASPTFGKIDLYCHYFVVPIRQIWKDSYDFFSQTGLMKEAEPPYVTAENMREIYNLEASTFDYKRAWYKHWTSMGLPPFFQLTSSVSDNDVISLLPFRAYNKIWWDFYRDPEVCRDESIGDYCDDTTIGLNERTDISYYLRFMLPRVRSIKNNWISDLFASSGQEMHLNWMSAMPESSYPYISSNGELITNRIDTTTLPSPYRIDADEELANPVEVTSANIRIVEALTRLAERLSLSGKRQIEALYARYGVKPNWSKMNLARYVGGAKSSVLVENLISTADTVNGSDGSPLGAKAGQGYCALSNLNIEVSVDEPSILMGIVSIMPHVHFVQGLSKKWQRKQFADFFQESLQYVGNVAVAKREVGYNHPGVNYPLAYDGQTFAFSDPYYEYKMGLDILAGDFMKYHNTAVPTDDPEARKQIVYMQSMEQYVDYPQNRQFDINNLMVDGDQYNKIFYYLGGSFADDVDDHFHLCIDKEVIIERSMEGFAIPTLETTKDPHKVTQTLSSDKML